MLENNNHFKRKNENKMQIHRPAFLIRQNEAKLDLMSGSDRARGKVVEENKGVERDKEWIKKELLRLKRYGKTRDDKKSYLY